MLININMSIPPSTQLVEVSLPVKSILEFNKLVSQCKLHTIGERRLVFECPKSYFIRPFYVTLPDGEQIRSDRV